MNKKTIYHLISFSVAIFLDRKRAGYRTYRPETSLPDSSSFPVAGDKSIISIRDGAFSEAMSGEQSGKLR
mgnify:CR=1 FL=1